MATNKISARKLKELPTTGEKLCWLFSKRKHLRGCYQCLVLEYWLCFDDISKPHRLTNPETITRAARHIQNDLGLWRPITASYVQKKFRKWAVKQHKENKI